MSVKTWDSHSIRFLIKEIFLSDIFCNSNCHHCTKDHFPFVNLILFITGKNIKLPSESSSLLFTFFKYTFHYIFSYWGGFNKSIWTFQFVTKLFLISVSNLNITLGIDGISLFFLLLTTLLIPLCILISWNSINSNLKGYLISFLLIEFF